MFAVSAANVFEFTFDVSVGPEMRLSRSLTIQSQLPGTTEVSDRALHVELRLNALASSELPHSGTPKLVVKCSVQEKKRIVAADMKNWNLAAV